MKLTFILPEAVARRFQAAYPKKRQSEIVANLLVKKMRLDDQQLARACREANALKQVEKDGADWEKLNVCAQ